MAILPIFIAITALIRCGLADRYERDLYNRLLSKYNVLVRPVVNSKTPVEVRMKLVLSQIVDVVSIRSSLLDRRCPCLLFRTRKFKRCSSMFGSSR